jgi:hypothetical protein
MYEECFAFWNKFFPLLSPLYSKSRPVPFLRNFHWGAKQEKRQNEKYEPSRFGERASLKRDFVKL